MEFPLDWVDGFIDEIRDYLYLREEDSLLIIMPNESYKLNSVAYKIMKHLLAGGKLIDTFKGQEPPEQVRKDLYYFFLGLCAMMRGCLGEGREHPAVENIDYARPFHKLPILSEVALTYRCNLGCVFCYAGCNRNHDLPEMTFDELGIIFDKIKNEAHVPSVSFTGGEPTLREDLPELVELAVKKGLRVNLISNGVLIDDKLASRLKSAGLASAQISVEAGDAETHDKQARVKGAFEKTLNGIRVMRAAKIPVHHNTTINTININSVHKLPALAKSLGLTRFSMNMIIPSQWIKDENPDLLVKYSDIGKTVLKVKEIAQKEGIRFLWYSPTPYCLFNPISHNLGNKGCAACDGLLSIDPEGRIIPCSSFFEPQGSLLHGNFKELWNAKRPCELREKKLAPDACYDCQYFDLCEGACPLYWQILGDKEIKPQP